MPTTRKKVIKTVYKDEDDSDQGGDFSDSGSEAEITQPSSSDEDFSDHNSEEEFKQQPKKQSVKVTKSKKANFTKSFLNKVTKQNNTHVDEDYEVEIPFSIKDLTEADKLLPSVLNLSESDSSEDESPKVSHKTNISAAPSSSKTCDPGSDLEINTEYKDVWSHNKQDNSEEIAHKTYLELEKHKNKIEETKRSIQSYVVKTDDRKESNIKDLLALGEEESPDKSDYIERFENDESDAEMEDWEEVKESKGIPKEGLQLLVDVPDQLCRKRKKVDIEMILKRKANRHRKESQVFKHKVHVLCWLGHGNYVSRVLNDQEVMANVLSLLPSKQCYPGDKVDIKYIEQITTWFKDKIILKQDKHENKFKPKAPPLKELLLQQTKNKVFSTKKYIIFAYVSMLRSLGLQCRIMINFVTVPMRPPASELLSLSTKPKNYTNKTNTEVKLKEKVSSSKCSKKPVKSIKIPQLDGNYDSRISDIENIMQLDGNDDTKTIRTRKSKTVNNKSSGDKNIEVSLSEDHVSPPKKPRRQTRSQVTVAKTNNMSDININNKAKSDKDDKKVESQIAKEDVRTTNVKAMRKSLSLNRQVKEIPGDIKKDIQSNKIKQDAKKKGESNVISKSTSRCAKRKENNVPKIIVSKDESSVSSKYFDNEKEKNAPSRKRSRTTEPKSEIIKKETKLRTRSVRANVQSTSRYFENTNESKISPLKKTKTEDNEDDNKRVSHKDLVKAKQKVVNSKNDVSDDLIHLMKDRIKEAKIAANLGVVKGKIKKESDEDSDYLPVESPKRKKSGSDDDFKVKKSTPKPKAGPSKKKDRRVLSTDDELSIHKVDMWAEVFVEELEEWTSVDVIAGKVHCTADIYRRATHPVTYVVGWDNNNHIKDLTKKYVPHWNTVTRKQRVEPLWWMTAVKPWLGPRTARDIEEDERLDRMQLEAPLPKSIAEYKNHPLYALRRHLLKFEAIYPPDAATLGFVRNEAVYARSCVYVCRSRDTWLKEAKVVRLGEQPYKVVKARPKWDRLSNKLITDKPLEVFGPWQVQDYEPPTAENGVVPRNAYGNVELFQECMLPKGTVHIKLPGLNRVAKKLNIDCAPAMTGFDFNGGWSHPVFDGFVVCEEFGEIITEAWLKDQEEQERKEVEKLEARVYGNWRKLIKGLLIKERLKAKYGFEDPSTSSASTKSKAPKLVVKKK